MGDSALRVAIVHDYLTQRGGAERVVLAMLDAFPDARLITSVYAPKMTYPEFRGRRVETTYLDSIPLFRRDPRLALPFLPRAFSAFQLNDVDVVLCSSSGFSHGIGGDTAKVVYCHNPPRWLYQTHDYVRSSKARHALKWTGPALRSWDRRAAASATTYLVNSTVVKRRVEKAYGVEAQILPPPVALDAKAARTPIPGLEPGFLLTIGRARGYKNTAVVARAMAVLPDERLVVVGGLSHASHWTSNVIDAGRVSDSQLRWLYANASALIAVSFEDFGLTPIEAYSFGTPALVLQDGGYLDTTEQGLTGGWIRSETPGDVAHAVHQFRQSFRVDRDKIISYADRWTQERFATDISRVVRDAHQAHRMAGSYATPAGGTEHTERRVARVVTAERRVRSGPWPAEAERRGARYDEAEVASAEASGPQRRQDPHRRRDDPRP